jgi:hypothetical protein
MVVLGGGFRFVLLVIPVLYLPFIGRFLKPESESQFNNNYPNPQQNNVKKLLIKTQRV